MKVLAKDEDLKPLDPNDLIPHLLVEGVISHEDYEQTKTIKDKVSRKVVRVPYNIGIRRTYRVFFYVSNFFFE